MMAELCRITRVTVGRSSQEMGEHTTSQYCHLLLLITCSPPSEIAAL